MGFDPFSLDHFGMFSGGDDSSGMSGMFAGLGGGGALGAITGSSAIYGSKPQPITPVTPADITGQAANANASALPTLQNLGQNVDLYNIGQRNKSLNSQIPGYQNLTQNESGMLQDWQHGNIGADVRNQIATSRAGKALAGGYGGSQMDVAGTARDLGLTSLDLQKMSTQALPGYLNTMDKLAVPDQFNVANGFLKPSYNPYGQYEQQVYNSNLAAAPDPAAAGAAAAQMGLIESILGIYSGGGERGITRYTPPSQPQLNNGGGGGAGSGSWYNNNDIPVNTGAQNQGYDYNTGNPFFSNLV